MAEPAPAEARLTVERYLHLVDDGVLRPDDRVELLEGVVVSMSPQRPLHASTVGKVASVLGERVGPGTCVRVQLPFVAGDMSVPEPDVVVAPGAHDDYAMNHPQRALLVVEVADSSVVQDRLTKSAMYAAAGVPEYWIVDLVDDCLEVRSFPDVEARAYRQIVVLRRGERWASRTISGLELAVDELLLRATP